MIFRTAYLLFASIALLCASAAAHPSLHMAEKRQWPEALAEARGNEALYALIQWQYMLDANSGAGFSEIMRFIDDNPEWPELKRLQVRAELSLRDGYASGDELIVWLEKYEPLTGIGRIALAKALQQADSGDERITPLIREGWVKGDFDEAAEREIRDQFNDILTQADDIARADRLLWEEKLSSAQRMLARVPSDYHALFEARIALLQNKKNASSLASKVASKHADNHGLLYDRMRYRIARNDHKGVRDILLNLPEDAPYPEKWWKQREFQIRKAVDEGDYKTAGRLATHYDSLEGADLANALWIDGWLRLEFLGEPQKALSVFSTMYDTVKYPVSRARAAYWAGRAAIQTGNKGKAQDWYAKAAEHPTTFYGQLAHMLYNGDRPLMIPAESSVSQSGMSPVLLQAIHLCMENGLHDLASKLVNHVAEYAQSDTVAASIATLGHKASLPHISVRAAKKALQRNIILIDTGYPRPEIPGALPVEPALTLAITRQESEFNPEARSPANALGLMQVLPATAKETARKVGMPFSKALLITPDYNFTIGSHYLSRLINAYGGSYVMAIAAYNAGPGNVSKWSRQFGTPGDSVESAINWIEKIPFAETRNYVQRVLENLQVYRHIESKGDARPELVYDLTR